MFGNPIHYSSDNIWSSKSLIGDLNGDGINDVASSESINWGQRS